MSKRIIFIDKGIIVCKVIFFACIVRRINIDHIDPTLMRLLQKFQAVQIISFKQEVVALSRSGSNLPVMFLGKHRDVILHLDIDGFFVLFPDETVFLCIQFVFDLPDGTEDFVIARVLPF